MKRNKNFGFIKRSATFEYVTFGLCFLPGFAAAIEFLIFWWNNNGLHTSKWDFWVAHPVHCIVTTLILLLSLILTMLHSKLIK